MSDFDNSDLGFLSVRCRIFKDFDVGFPTTQMPVWHLSRGREGGGESHMKGAGMLVVSLRGVNFGF